MSRAVATIKDVDEYGPIIEWHQHLAELKGRTLHLTQPAQAVDVGAVNAVIRELRKWPKEETFYDHRATRLACADKLTAALPKDGAAGVDEVCTCSPMQRAHGHHFGCPELHSRKEDTPDAAR